MAEKIETLEQALEVIKGKDNKIEALNNELKDAKEAANDAIAKYNAIAPKAPKDFDVTLKNKKVVVVNFGVHYDGKYYSKEDLVNAPEVVEKLVKKGSGAISFKEG